VGGSSFLTLREVRVNLKTGELAVCRPSSDARSRPCRGADLHRARGERNVRSYATIVRGLPSPRHSRRAATLKTTPHASRT
jgi:hypothetical protein